MGRAQSAAKVRVVRPDSKGRVALGTPARGVSSFLVRELPSGALMLEPQVEIPAREAWLHRNPEAKARVMRGLEQVGGPDLVDLGSFADFVDEED